MDKIISTIRLKSDPLCRQIIDHLSAKEKDLGLQKAVLYYDFPLFRDYEELLIRPSILLFSPNHGIICIKTVDTPIVGESADEDLDQFHSLLYSKLLSSKRLRKGRKELLFPLQSVLFLSQDIDVEAFKASENEAIASLGALADLIAGWRADTPIEEDALLEARSIIEGVKALTRPSPRRVEDEKKQSKALIFRKLEEEIVNFDVNQRRAALTVTAGPQRIRGLAGSGKTIVLAWKAAHLHLTSPDKKILFTFYTKSLYELIRRQVTRFYRHFRDADPNWENLHILHAWGGKTEAGVYYNACLDHEILPKNWSEARNHFEPFNFVCSDLIKRTEIRPKYDYFLIDEAQDFPIKFFELAFKLTKGERDAKSIVWAYDEFQSILEPRIRNPHELFGEDKDNQPRIDLDRAASKVGLSEHFTNDLILHKCYRNPRDVLVCAHALGLGIYGPQIVQMLQGREHWEDVGYEIEKGDFEVGSKTILRRPDENSPLSILKYQEKDEIVKSYLAIDIDAEVKWAANQIRSFCKEGLRPEEILVVCLDDRNAKDYFALLSGALAEHEIGTHDLLSNPFTASKFAVEDRVTLSTVYRAKGNEAPAVLAIGCDAMFPLRRLRRGRNRLFTALTRAKAWLRVSAIKKNGGEELFAELDTALAKSPRLVFEWPDLNSVETIQRDMSKREQRAKKVKERYIREMQELGLDEDEALADLMTEKKK